MASRTLFFLFISLLLLLSVSIVHAQCRETTLQAIKDEVNGDPLSTSQRHTIIDVAYRMISEVNPHGNLHATKLKIDPLSDLLELKRMANTMDTFNFYSSMLAIYTKMNDRNTFLTLPEIFPNTRAYVGYILRPYWTEGANRPKLAVIFKTSIFNVTVDIPINSTITAVDGKDPIALGLSISEDGYAATYSSNLWDAGFVLTRRFLDRSRLPSNPFLGIHYTTQTGTKGFKKVPWRYIDCRPIETDDDSRIQVSSRELVDAEFTDDVHELYPQLGDVTDEIPRVERDVSLSQILTLNRQSDEPFYNFSFERFELGEENFWFLQRIETELGSIYSLVIFTWEIELTEGQQQNITTMFESLPSDAKLIWDIRGLGDLNAKTAKTARYLTYLLTGKDLPQVPKYVLASKTMLQMAEANNPDGILGEDSKFAIIHSLKSNETYSAPYGDLFSTSNLISDRPEIKPKRVYFNKLALISISPSIQFSEAIVAWLRDSDISPYLMSINGRTGGNVASKVSYSELHEQYPSIWPDELPDGVDLTTAWNRIYRSGRRAGEDIQYVGVKPDEFYYFTYEDITGNIGWQVERPVQRWFMTHM